LTLIRDNADTDKWHLSAAEVERIADASAIPDEPEPSFFDRDNGRNSWLLAAAIVIAVVTWLVLRTRRRKGAIQGSSGATDARA
jgi:hypothetical protein